MPRISSFYGIVIAMYYREHGVPQWAFAAPGGAASGLDLAEEGEVLESIDPLP